jgi:hypothetical protein
MRIAIPILVLAARCYAAGCTGYGNFITFTYDPSGAALSASLSNFPNLFNATDANLKTTGNGGKMMNNNGWDVCVSSVDDNTTYPLQIASYNGSTGALWFYFKPAITPKTSSTYHLWVGKDVASDPSSRTVWDSNYSEVYLLQENGAPNADTLNVYADSAQSGGKTLTGGKNPTPAVGIVGTAQSFNGVASAEYLPIAASLSTTNNASIFGVVNAVADSTSNLVVYDTRTSGCSGGYFIPYVDGSNGHAKCITDGGGKSVDGGVDIRNATHTLACVLDAGTLRLYVDGVSAGTPQPGASFGGGGGTPAIGKACGTGAGAGHFKGTIQNFSISNTGRSADWEKLEAYQILHPLVAITAVGLSSNKPTITSFSCTPTVAEGSATTCTFTVANATSTVVSGACPWSFNGCHYTGASPATFTPEFNTAFQLTATNEYGATISAPAYVTVTRPGASAANPVLTNVSVANSSSTSVRFTASSDTPAEWSGRCGTAAGPSGTVVPTPVLWARANGPAPHGYAIMNITFAITGLSPSTHYHCYATATNDRGSTTTSDQQITTGAAETTTPFRVSFPSPHTRLNGQFNGEYGMTLTGKMTDGDTDYWTWADDGMEYGLYQDGKGVQGGQTPAIGMIRWAPGNPPVPTQLATVTPFSGTATSENGVLSLRGVQYGFFLYHGYGGVTCCFNVIKSLDHWTTSQSPQTGGANGPNVANVAGVDQPTISTGTISGSSWSSGTMTLTVGAWGTGNVPPANTQVDVAGSTNCDGSYVVTASSANTVAFAHANASCSAGTVKFMHSMTPGCGAAGAPSACISTNGGAYWLISPIQPCQDYSQNCVFRANMDGWVYFHALYNGIVAVRVEDLYLQDITKWRVYKGVQGTNDFRAGTLRGVRSRIRLPTSRGRLMAMP